MTDWTCRRCTLLNQADTKHCEICYLSRIPNKACEQKIELTPLGKKIGRITREKRKKKKEKEAKRVLDLENQARARTAAVFAKWDAEATIQQAKKAISSKNMTPIDETTNHWSFDLSIDDPWV